MKKTKIVATIGPSSENEEVISKLILEGVDVFRFNFSHGTHEKHFENLEKVRRLSKELNRTVAALMDLSGPKIRLGIMKNPVPVGVGDKLKIVFCEKSENDEEIPLPLKVVFDNVNVNDYLYIADGTVKIRVDDKKSDIIYATVLTSGVISSRKGLNLPNVKLDISALTEKDKLDLNFGIKAGFDFVAMSFVRSKDDVLQVKEIVASHGCDIPVISKIEKSEAIFNIDEIIDVSDGIMVARGDLGIEIDMEKVPIYQKMIIEKANKLAKPVITATQMLTSMIKHSRPTRAEVSDIANAVLDGTDAVMLSDETTVGEYPVEAVRVMRKTIEETEKIYKYYRYYELPKKMISSAIAQSAVKLAEELEANALIVFTKSGASVRRISRNRPKCGITAVATEEKILRRLALSWGVNRYVLSKESENSDELLRDFIEGNLKDIDEKEIYIATIGQPSGIPGSTNVIRTIRRQDVSYVLHGK